MGMRLFIIIFATLIALPAAYSIPTKMVEDEVLPNQPIIYAIDHDQEKVVQEWLDANHSPLARINNKIHEGLLERAAAHSAIKSFEILLKVAHARYPNSTLTDSRGTPLLVTLSALAVPGKPSTQIYDRMVSLLLTVAPESVTITDRAYIGDGRTALHQAASVGNLELLKLLMSRGADVNAKNSTGETALHLAARFGHLEAAKLLVASGALVNEKTKYTHSTPLMAAAEMGHENIIRMLMISGAQKDTRDIFGKTAPERFREYVSLYSNSAKPILPPNK